MVNAFGASTSHLSSELEDVMLQSGIATLASLFQESAPIEIGQKFLHIQLNLDQAALLALDSIISVETITLTEILPVPHMPSAVLGIYNWRGEMLWLVDLSQQVGFSPLLQRDHASSTLTAIVIEVKGRSLGLAVSEVHDIEVHDIQQLQPVTPGLFPAKLLSYVRGYLTNGRSTSIQRIPVLDVTTILQDPLLQVHQPHHL